MKWKIICFEGDVFRLPCEVIFSTNILTVSGDYRHNCISQKKITYFESYRKLKYKEILFIIFLFILFPHATGIGIFFESFLPRIIFYKLLYLIRIP